MKSNLEKQYQDYLRYCLRESIPALPFKEWVQIYQEFELENA